APTYGGRIDPGGGILRRHCTRWRPPISQSSREPPRFKPGTPPVFIAATDTPPAACTSRARASDSYVRHGAERLDLSVTFLVGSVRSGDERSAHLRTVPARFDSEANCFCGVDATGGKICHWSFLI